MLNKKVCWLSGEQSYGPVNTNWVMSSWSVNLLSFGKELFILFAASAFRKLSSIYVFSYFPFGFEGRIWDLIVSVPDHCLSFYFTSHCWQA